MDKNKKWEIAGLVAIMGCIGVGFLIMSVALIRSTGQQEATRNEPVSEQNESEAMTEPNAGSDEAPFRTRELRNSYRRPLALHDVESFDVTTSRGIEKTEDYGVVIPNVPGASANPAFSSMMESMPMPGPSPRSPDRKDDKKADGKDDDKKTGWGWLADDIAVSRMTRDNKKNDDSKSNANRTETDDEREESDPRTDNPQMKQNETILFMDASYRPVHRETVTERSPDSARDQAGRELRDEDSNNKDRPRDQRTDVASEENRADKTDTAASGLVMRDPFARNQEALVRDAETASWAWGRPADSARQPGDASRADTRDRSERSPAAGRFEDPRMAESMAGRDWSERSAPVVISAPVFASDAAFNSGGGYSAMGFDAARSDAFFSGAGAFGGGMGYTPLNSTTPSGAGGLQPIGSSFGSPLSGSDGGGSLRGLDPERAGPRTLPW